MWFWCCNIIYILLFKEDFYIKISVGFFFVNFNMFIYIKGKKIMIFEEEKIVKILVNFK